MNKLLYFFLLNLSLFDSLNHSERKLALVIGNSLYAEYPLANPVNDALKMKETLEGLGFKVTLLLNGNQKSIKIAIADFGNQVGLDKSTVGLFYYAGHGIQANGKNYLVPVDAQIKSEADYDIYCVDIEGLTNYLEKAENQMNMLILDACRNNPYAKARSLGKSGGLAAINAPSGTMIAFATSPGKTASDGYQENGLYTQELIKAMKIPDIKVEDVFKQVRIQVKKLSLDQQIPWENSSITGDFYFVRNPKLELINPSTQNTVLSPPAPATNVTANLGFVFINNKKFKMGATGRPFNEQPIHEVEVGNFWMSKFEVTVKEWQTYCDDLDKKMPIIPDETFDDTYWRKRLDHPITNITWFEAAEYANWLSSRKGLPQVYKILESSVSWNPNANGYRLPTEAEWELSARIGNYDSPFAGSLNEQEVSWSTINSDDRTHPVGLKKANEANIHDMSGNVWEWCWDWYDEYYYKKSERVNPLGILAGNIRAIRGGSWLSADNRVTVRKGRSPFTKSTEVGFRLVRND